MTSYDDTKVQLTINRMNGECYENVPDKSSTELYLISQDPTSIAKIDLDAQSRTDAEISSIQSDLNALSTEVSTLSEWTTTQIDDLIGDVQEVSSQATQNAQDIADISANLTHSTVRRWEYVEYNGLTFTAEEANSTVAMQKVGSAPNVSLEYSTGDGWHDFIVGETTVTLANIGDKMYLRAKTTNSGFSTANAVYNHFVMSGKVAASDSIMYLLKNDGDLSAIPTSQCFNSLFEGCSSLTQAPELPATTLAEFCYNSMFLGCLSLTSAPALPGTTLAYLCYAGMFQGCTSLTTAPELPATTLASNCYVNMFYGCSSLTTVPELPATTLAQSCYYGMFRGCSSLNKIKIAYTGNFSGTGVPSYAFFNWVNGVSADGTFYYDGDDTTTGASAIPTGWTVEPLTPSQQGLTFTAEEANSTIAMQAIGSAPSVSLEYTTDGSTWNDFIVDSTTVTLANVGDKMYLRAKTTNGGFASSSTYNKFVMTGKIAASDSIMYLLKNDGDLDTLPRIYCFYRLFNDCTSLTQAPELPATTLTNNCYLYMFNGCTSLTSAPELPATTLNDSCYAYMFLNCSSLRTPTELPATTLAYACYSHMFQGCSSLTTAPELPATTLVERCYIGMFYGCSSLTTAPELPATTMTSFCYSGMFKDCTSLNTIKIGYTGNFNAAFENWVQGVASSGTFYYDGSDTTTGASAIPINWTVQSF